MQLKQINFNDNDNYFKVFLHNFEKNSQIKRPIVLICPGGGYVKCAQREMDIVATEFLRKGFHAIVVKYSVYETDKQIKFGTQLQQLANVFDWVLKNADQNAIDVNQIHLLGFSAGGNLVANFATHFKNQSLIGKKFVSQTKIRSVLLGYPRLSYEDYIDDKYLEKDINKLNDDEKKSFMWYNQKKLALFGTENPTIDQINIMSPLQNVTDKFPPCFIFQAADDKLTKKEDFLKFIIKLNENNVNFESHLFRAGGHGFSVLGASDLLSDSNFNVSSSRPDNVNNSLEKWINLAIEWINYFD